METQQISEESVASSTKTDQEDNVVEAPAVETSAQAVAAVPDKQRVSLGHKLLLTAGVLYAFDAAQNAAGVAMRALVENGKGPALTVARQRAKDALRAVPRLLTKIR